MDKNIVSNPRVRIKDEYQTAHESLCAKLHQAYTLADLLANHDLSEGQSHSLSWCLEDILKAASEECESLTPRDFDPESES